VAIAGGEPDSGEAIGARVSRAPIFREARGFFRHFLQLPDALLEQLRKGGLNPFGIGRSPRFHFARGCRQASSFSCRSDGRGQASSRGRVASPARQEAFQPERTRQRPSASWREPLKLSALHAGFWHLAPEDALPSAVRRRVGMGAGRGPEGLPARPVGREPCSAGQGQFKITLLTAPRAYRCALLDQAGASKESCAASRAFAVARSS